MFTGIVEALGRVRRVTRAGDVVRLAIAATDVCDDLEIGDSVAVNGVCLTAVSVGGPDRSGVFDVEVVPETLRRTTLGTLAEGHGVNLERSVTPTTRMGGHFVQGHVDGTGDIRRVTADGDGGSVLMEIQPAPDLMRYVVPKGYVAVDGASLTVVDHGTDTFRIALIPHTLQHTVAGNYGAGTKVNLEADVLGKYVERLVAAHLAHGPARGAVEGTDG